MIPEGTYRARAIDGKFDISSTGKEYVAIRFQVLDPELEGEHVFWSGFFTEKTEARTLESLRYCGWSTDDVTDLTGIDTHDVDVVVKHETYEGKTRAKVAWVNRIGGGGSLKVSAQLTEAKKKAFAERMRASAIKSRYAATTSATPPAKKSAAADDDVGF